MRAGDSTQQPFTLSARGQRQEIGTLICHEDLVGRDAAQWGTKPNLFLNPSNLAWFDDSWALAQRLQIVRMRALETGRPILRITNTGVTAQIDAFGKVVAQLPTSHSGVLSGAVQPTRGSTPYMLVGDVLIVVLCTLSILLAFAWTRRNKSAHRK
jgi:apolipoprotein N-acyltransferase